MPFVTYSARPIEFLGIENHKGLRLKLYSIIYGDEPFQRTAFEPGLNLAIAALPMPAVTAEGPGVGFVILHRGRTGNYLILSRWDRENELPTRVFITDEKGWRPAKASESFCVWDLQVIWQEREAYVRTLLAGKAVEDYLQIQFRD